MDVYEAIYQRTSIREFEPETDVSEEVVEKMLTAAIQAPSAGNIQPWRFWVVRDNKAKKELSRAALGQTFIAQAPVVIVVSADTEASAFQYGGRGASLYAVQDTAAAIENLLLCVIAEGLGACWIGAFDEQLVSAAIDLPSAIRPLALIPVGFPLQAGQKPIRKPVCEVTRYL